MRILVILITGLLALPTGALAHAQLVKANPAVGSTVTLAPTQLWLKFDQVIRVPPSAVRLTWPDGHQLVIRALVRDPADADAVFAPLPAPLGPGAYRLEWRALSPDGHNTQGRFVFTVAG